MPVVVAAVPTYRGGGKHRWAQNWALLSSVINLGGGFRAGGLLVWILQIRQGERADLGKPRNFGLNCWTNCQIYWGNQKGKGIAHCMVYGKIKLLVLLFSQLPMCQTQQLFLNPYPNAHLLIKIKLRVCVLLVDPPLKPRMVYQKSHVTKPFRGFCPPSILCIRDETASQHLLVICLLDRGTLSQMCVRVFSNVEKIMIMASFRSFSYRPKTITTIFRRKKWEILFSHSTGVRTVSLPEKTGREKY